MSMVTSNEETNLMQRDAVMDGLVGGRIKAQDLTDEVFAPYGNIIKPRRSGQQGDRKYAYRPNEEAAHVPLVMTNGEPCMRIMHQFKRGLGFKILARHRRVSQCLGSLQGKEWFIAMVAPQDVDGDVPLLDRLAAFRIPGDRIIKIHVDTWHAGPHFVHDECMFMSLENVDTNTKDFDTYALPAEYHIEA
jgi:ureidoglycolate hydrolase